MTRRNDMEAALERKGQGQPVPIWELEFHAWDAASGRHVVLGEEMERLTPAEQEKALHENAEIMVEVARDLNFSAITPPGSYWYVAPGELAFHVLPGDLPDRQFAILKELVGDEIMLISGTGGVLCADYSMEFCEQLMLDPDGFQERAENMLAYGIEGAKRLRDLGAGAVFTASDIADNNGVFFNPEQMDRFILPYAKRWAEAVHEMGMYAIMHTDGNIMKCVDDLANTGLDAIQAIDATAGMDIDAARVIVGDRLCFCGNVDCGLLLRGTPDEIYDVTEKLLSTEGKTGAFSLGASNAVQHEVPIENYRAMINAWKAFSAPDNES
jgi:uroporphyrinogen decarboxylase